jgi:hypothetical protein
VLCIITDVFVIVLKKVPSDSSLARKRKFNLFREGKIYKFPNFIYYILVLYNIFKL